MRGWEWQRVRKMGWEGGTAKVWDTCEWRHHWQSRRKSARLGCILWGKEEKAQREMAGLVLAAVTCPGIQGCTTHGLKRECSSEGLLFSSDHGQRPRPAGYIKAVPYRFLWEASLGATRGSGRGWTIQRETGLCFGFYCVYVSGKRHIM